MRTKVSLMLTQVYCCWDVPFVLLIDALLQLNKFNCFGKVKSLPLMFQVLAKRNVFGRSTF